MGSLHRKKKSSNPQDWDYYKRIWGFDPASDRIRLRKGWVRYEVWFPLEHDPDFYAIGVEIGARVDWKDERISNAIIFRCQAKEARVECTHTVIYQGHKEEVLELANDPISVPDNNFTLSPARLPPEEHFVALKSYVAGLAEIGIAQLFRASYISNEYDPENAIVGFNSLMQKQVAAALQKVAVDQARVFLQGFLLDLITHSTPAWVEPRLPYLDITYNISEILFHDAKALAFAKQQFPTLPWDQWADVVKIKWDELIEWAEWFSRIETIPMKGDSPYGLPSIGVDYPQFARIIRESRIEELVDQFWIDPAFANNCRKVFHVVIEGENWGGALRTTRELNIMIAQFFVGYLGLFASLLIWGLNPLGFTIGGGFWFIVLLIYGLWRKRHENNKTAKIKALNSLNSQSSIGLV